MYLFLFPIFHDVILTDGTGPSHLRWQGTSPQSLSSALSRARTLFYYIVWTQMGHFCVSSFSFSRSRLWQVGLWVMPSRGGSEHLPRHCGFWSCHETWETSSRRMTRFFSKCQCLGEWLLARTLLYIGTTHKKSVESSLALHLYSEALVNP